MAADVRLSAEQGDGAGALLYVARYVGGAVDEGPDVGALRAGVVAGVATRVSSRELAFGRKVTQKSVPRVDCGPHCAEPRSGARSNARSIHRPTAASLHGGRGCPEGLMAVLFRCKVTNKIPQGQFFFEKVAPPEPERRPRNREKQRNGTYVNSWFLALNWHPLLPLFVYGRWSVGEGAKC